MSRDKVTLNSEEIKPQFHSNLMQRFGIDLMTSLGLAMPNQCCHAITKYIFGWFVGGIFGQETRDPYI